MMMTNLFLQFIMILRSIDTTIKRDHNPSCSIETYGGGMICCHHEIYLLDQNQVIPPQTFRYRMKYRFWYEDPRETTNNIKKNNTKSISEQVWGPELPYQNAFFMFRETEIAHGEYDVPKCNANKTKYINEDNIIDEDKDEDDEECVHVVIGNFQMKDAMHECTGRSDVWCSPVNLPNHTYPQSNHVALVHVSPHCHGPACKCDNLFDVLYVL